MVREVVKFRAPAWPVVLAALALTLVMLVVVGLHDDGPVTGPGPVAAGGASDGETRASAENDPCWKCHDDSEVMPAVNSDWEASKHFEEDISCVDCHLTVAGAPGAFSHNGRYITVAVSPEVCAKCHEDEVEQFTRSLHALGSAYYELLYAKGTGDLPYLESQLEGGFLVSGGKVIDHAATIRGCQACHSRHSFSIAEARHPETCGQCHLGPDHPHIEIYQESKHGNIYASEGASWNWDVEDWEAGTDYRAPTCAACHMSRVGDMPATHDVGERLSWELESPVSRHTDNKANNLGTTIGSGLTWQQKRANMQAVCVQCHSETWTENYYVQADYVVELYNAQYTASKVVMDGLYRDGLLTNASFDEPIEFTIYEMWHHQGRRARVGAFMMGPDYVQWHGFYEVLQAGVEIDTTATELREKAAAMPPADDDGGDDDGEEDEATEALWAVAVALAVVALLLSIIALRRRPAPAGPPPNPPPT